MKCLICGKEFYCKPSQIKRGRGKYCSNACKAKAILGDNGHRFKKGLIPWNLGKKVSTGRSGIEHWNWQGGKTTIQMRVRNSFNMRLWRSDVYKRDDYTCQNCGKRGYELEAHHINSFSNIIKEFNINSVDDAMKCTALWDISNGVTLCKRCHRESML